MYHFTSLMCTRVCIRVCTQVCTHVTMSITVGRAALQPRLWGHILDSHAMRGNSSKYTNLCFLPPSALGREKDKGSASECLSPLPPPPGDAKARRRVGWEEERTLP